VLDAHPGAKIQLAIVWSNHVGLDSAAAAADAATRVGAGDPRVVHFVEAEDRPVGLAVNRVLGWPDDREEAAWDIYLFWPPDAAWGEALPKPADALFQLGAHRDEPGFANGDDLVARLREATAAITKP
jgi:hypothetical protein